MSTLRHAALIFGGIVLALPLNLFALGSVSIGDSFNSINISSRLEYLEDPAGSLGISDAVGNTTGWRLNRKNYVNFGYTSSVYWFRCAVHDTARVPRTVYMEIDFPTLDYIDLYLPDGAKGWKVKKAGDSLPFAYRDVPDRNFVFRLALEPGRNVFYLRVKTVGSFRFNTTLITPELHAVTHQKTVPLFWLFFGMMVFIAVYNLLIFLATGERAYLYLFFFCAFYFLHQFKIRGFASQYLWDGSIDWAGHSTYYFMALIIIASCLFLRAAIDTEKEYRVLDRMIVAIGILLPAAAMLLPAVIDYNLAVTILFGLVLLFVPFGAGSLVYLLFKGNRYARFVMAGLVFVGVFNLDGALTAVGLLHTPVFSEWGHEMGITIFMIFSSLGLADKINMLKNTLVKSEETIRAQNAALQRSNEELIATNEEMEATNEELNATLEEFEAQNEEMAQARNELAESESRYRSIVEDQIELIIRVTPEGTITFANEAFCGLYRLPRERIVGLNVSDLESKKDAEIFLDEFKLLTPREPVRMFTVKITKTHDRHHWIQVNAKGMFSGSGRLSEIQVVGRDITERVTIEAQLAQAQKMEAIGTLAGGLAHDFNNVLGAIMGSASILDILLRDADIDKKDEVLTYIETINSASGRAAEMIRQLMSLSRRQEIRMVPVDLGQSLHNVQKICRNTLPKSVKLDFNIPKSPRVVLGDPTQVEQAILNLCVNASHAMTLMRGDAEKEGGSLLVTMNEVNADAQFCLAHPEARRDRDYYSILVSDNGVGMDADTSSKIFEPFFTTKGKDIGTGLGLAMVYNIVRQHHGFMDVISEPDAGTTMIVHLPRPEDQDLLQADDKSEAGIVPGSGTVLIIDDEEGVRTVASGILRQAGYTVHLAESGEAGVALFREKRGEIDAVLLDMSMPGMSGLEVFEVLREIDRGVSVLISSGFSLDIKIKKAMDLGARGFVQKPYSARVLTEKVGDAVSLRG